MRFKKCLSAFLVSALILTSFALPTGFTSSAAETGITETETVEEQTGTDGSQEAVPDTEVSTETPEGSLTEESDTSEEGGIEAGSDETGTGAEESDATESDQNVSNKSEESGVTGEVQGADVPQVMSLLPLEEVNAYLVLNDYSEEEIKNMPLGDVLDMLRDSEGNKISIDKNATTVWTYYKDESNNIIKDEYHVISREETVDLSLFEYSRDYTMELIVGSGQQLDSNNVRYLVKVYLSEEISENIDYEVYTENADGTRSQVVPQRIVERTTTSTVLGIEDIPVSTIIYMLPEDEEDTEYYLGLKSQADEHPDIKADVYTMEELMKELVNPGSGVALTDQILNQNMEQSGAGYKGKFNEPEDIFDWGNMFFIIYRDVSKNTIISFSEVSFAVTKDMSYMTSELFTYGEDEQKEDIVCRYDQNVDVQDFTVDMGSGVVSSVSSVNGEYYMLEEGYSADEEYYLALDAHSAEWTDDANGHVVKAVVGHYDSMEEAEGQEDIKGQIIPEKTDRESGKYGYKANYNAENGGVNFTVFFDDDSVWKFNVRVAEYDPVYDTEYMQSFNDAPVIGAQDPWFRVTGANDTDGNPLDTYIVENGKEINMDTMYGYGYQTVLINEDVTEIQPTFWKAESDNVKVTKMYINDGEPFEEGDTIECTSDETDVVFHVTIEDENGEHTKRYNVSFVKKGSGSQLYVVDPKGAGEDDPVRSVFLDEYFEYKHDIFIANVGDKELTGLRVELDATNVKLDDYWTVGGENNDSLAPFDTTEVHTQYGELANIAKIRLLPDGEGEIEGTLTIYADGQDPVIIKLSGQAQNPQITTEELGEAVKYVPYSYMVTTNNMYDWTDVKFTMDGELPDGVEFIESTGEIYGVPLETGTFPITVTAEFTSDSYEFESSTVDYVLTVNDNTNENVYEASDENYQILEPIGTDVSGTYDFVLTETGDQLFVSNGEFDEFQDLWLNGEKLTEGVDYTKVAGSTRITISGQTFRNKANKNGTNTIAAEYRVGNDRANDLKRTAQNFRLNLGSGSGSGSGSWDSSTSFGSGMGGRGSGSGSSAYVSPYVTMIAQVVDKEDHPLVGYTVELHSTPKTAQTDGEGKARFNNVDFGNHTITVKDQDGRTEASKNFTIAEGTKTSFNGDTITARRGSGFLVKMVLDGNSLSFQSIEEVAVETGDSTGSMAWLYVVAMAGAAVAVYAVQRKRRAR